MGAGKNLTALSLVTPQRASPRSGITVKPETAAPTIVPLNGAFLSSLFLLTTPSEAGVPLRGRRVGQLFFQILKGEEKHSAIALGRKRIGRCQQDRESKPRQDGSSYAFVQCCTQLRHCSSSFL